MRKWIIATAVLLTVPMVGAAAVIVAPPVQEQLVEGHTVFSVIQVRNSSDVAREEYAAAVAVLVREYTTFTNNQYARFPGVLWFNDQYLVNQESPRAGVPTPLRYPCGAVIGVNSGDPVPLVGGVPAVPSSAAYVESYRITDPNDNAWDVDKWSYDPDVDPLNNNSYLMWSVSVNNDQTSYHTPDNGVKNCFAKDDLSAGCGTPLMPFVDDTPNPSYGGPDLFTQDQTYEDTKDNDTDTRLGDGEGRYRCLPAGDMNADLGPGYTTPAGGFGFQYNAVLYFFLDDLTDFGGIKNHSVASSDVSGCHPTTHPAPSLGPWPCPGGDDNAEGNSHPYNKEREWPSQLSEGRNNHGGSSGCGAGAIGSGAQYEHATCNIDIYFGYSQAVRPVVANYRVYDTEGATAPYHCHESIDVCNEEEFNSAL